MPLVHEKKSDSNTQSSQVMTMITQQVNQTD